MRMVDTLSFAAAAGVAIVLSACSDPVPPSPQGVVSIEITTQPVNSNGTCAAVHRVNLPSSARSAQVLSSTQWASMLTDGEGGAVSCTVAKKGSGFSVTGSISVPKPAQGWGKVSFGIDNISDGQSDAVGRLVAADDLTGDAYQSTECKYSVAGGGGLKVAEGRIWATVDCENFAAPNLTGSACLVEQSYVLFQNCATQ